IRRMQRYEVRLWVSLDDTISRLLKLHVGGKILAVKRPVGMCAQLFITFIETICRQEERIGIRNMNCDRHIQSAGRFPHLIEPFVVDFHQWTCGYVFAQIESKSLKYFQSTRSGSFSCLELFSLKPGIVWHLCF